jgi:hypothetical protein
MIGEVNIINSYILRHVNSGRGEIDYPFESGFHHMVGRPLGSIWRRGDQSYFHIQFTAFFFQATGADYLMSGHYFTNLERVAVKGSNYDKTALLQLLVPEKGPSQIAHSDQGTIPGPVHTKKMGNGLEQILGVVANPPDSKLTEVGQIFSDLRRIDLTFLGQFVRGNYLLFPLNEFLKDLDINGHPVHGCPRDSFGF